jgi:agmatine deiminase
MESTVRSTPRAEGFRQPAEWALHEACWVAWPHDAKLWRDELPKAQASFVQMCRAIAALDGKGRPQGERLEVLVPDAATEGQAARALEGVGARFHRIPVGDIWLRDTAPIFVTRGEAVASVRFAFNGWGGKYLLPHDDQVASQVAGAAGLSQYEFPFVLEGGSLDTDGEGTFLTTRQCLQNPNRNPGVDEQAMAAHLSDALGATKVLWLDEGLLNDHTDGHVDTLARFVAPGKVVCMAPSGPRDPNRQVLQDIAKALRGFTDAKGRPLEVVEVASPGLIEDADDRVMPASYVNFYIGNAAVVVPAYGSPQDDKAAKAISHLFPNHRTVSVPAKAILSGGGAFHCITQQQPKGAR